MKYWLVKIDLLDHSKSQLQTCGLSQDVVYGLLTHEDESSVRICPWVVGLDISEPSCEVFTLVKHSGMKIEKIREEEFGE